MATNRHVLEPSQEVIREHLRWLERLDGRALSDPTMVGRLVLPLAAAGLTIQTTGPGQPFIASRGAPGRPRVALLVQSPGPAVEPAADGAGLVAMIAALTALQVAGQPVDLDITLICADRQSELAMNLDDLELPAFDLCLWDGGGWAGDRPWFALGSHGLVLLRLRVSGAGGALGMGAILPNPAWRLIWALAALKSSDEEVRIPTFYDPVCVPTTAEMETHADAALALARDWLGGTRPPLPGLRGQSLALARSFSPSVTIMGVGVDGPSRALPCSAWADLAITLVPDQTPDLVVSALIEHLAALRLDDVGVEVVDSYAGHTMPPTAPLAELAVAVGAEVFGADPFLMPYSLTPTPLTRLPAAGTLAALGVGIGAARGVEREWRVGRLAYLLTSLLPGLPAVLAGETLA